MMIYYQIKILYKDTHIAAAKIATLYKQAYYMRWKKGDTYKSLYYRVHVLSDRKILNHKYKYLTRNKFVAIPITNGIWRRLRSFLHVYKIVGIVLNQSIWSRSITHKIELLLDTSLFISLTAI